MPQFDGFGEIDAAQELRHAGNDMRLKLIPHPATPCPHVSEISATVQRDGKRRLYVRYVAQGDMASLRLPAQGAPERTDGLWRHSCFEVFVRPHRGEAYTEFNFAPSTAWAAYQFDSYRNGMAALDTAPPHIVTESGEGRFVLSAEVHGLSDAPLWNVGLSAVIETLDGAISYWALAHPPGQPDFHHSDCFALELGATVRT